MRVMVSVAVLLFASIVQADVYKCVENGKQVFSDVPCSSSAQKITVRPSTAQESGEVAEARREADRKKFSYMAKAQRAVSNGDVFIGMLEKDVVASWGLPDKKNADIYGGAYKEQWIYRRGKNGTQYVYLQNGAVSALQDRP